MSEFFKPLRRKIGVVTLVTACALLSLSLQGCFYVHTIITDPIDKAGSRSQEGIRPLEECIKVMRKSTPCAILNPSEGLTKAAAELMNDQQKYGGIGHISRKGANPQQRIEKYGMWDICSSEDITYGSFEARQIVIFLLIDDGVPNRGHRENILNPCFQFAGVANGGHPDYETMCVIDFAGDYKTK